MRNLKLALRTLSRTPFVTTVAVLSLGLGIGANSAIYSIFYRMVRQDLTVSGADRLVNFSAPGPKNGSQSCGSAGPCTDVFSYPMFRDLQSAKLPAFVAIAGHRDIGANISFEQHAFARGGLLVSGSYFPILRFVPHWDGSSRRRTMTQLHRRRSCSRTGSGRRISARIRPSSARRSR